MREAVSTVQILTKAFYSPGFCLYSQERFKRQKHENEVNYLSSSSCVLNYLSKFSFWGKFFAFYQKSQFFSIQICISVHTHDVFIILPRKMAQLVSEIINGALMFYELLPTPALKYHESMKISTRLFQNKFISS